MSPLPYTLYTAEAVRQLDRTAIETFNIPGLELMNWAGRAAFEAMTHWRLGAQRIMVCCGGGNNGGDGYVIARLAHEAGMEVTLISLVDTAVLKGDARAAMEAAVASGLTVQPYNPELLVTVDVDVIIDALLGTGLDRDVGGEWAEAIELINRRDAPVLAVDIPSGLHADSGRVLGTAIRAYLTVTFIGLKRGLLTGAGPDHVGQLQFDDLGLPPEVYDHAAASGARIHWASLKYLLPSRPRHAHKGMFGHVLVIGGNEGMAGAVRMAAEAAARVGAGLVTVATRSAHTVAMAAARPELMWQGVEDAKGLRPLLGRANVLAIGPGLGQDAWAREMLAVALESSLPLVVDADALNLLAKEPLARGNWIMTPHPAEAGRLLGCGADEVNHDRFAAVEQLAERYRAVAILKGAGSLVAQPDPGAVVALCNEGNPGMACGGMGDLLTGLIAGMVAQGLSLHEAARAGVALHAAAGDKAAASGGERGMLAGDLLLGVRRLVN